MKEFLWMNYSYLFLDLDFHWLFFILYILDNLFACFIFIADVLFIFSWTSCS